MTNHKIKFQKCIKIIFENSFKFFFKEIHDRNQWASQIRTFYSSGLLESEYDS